MNLHRFNDRGIEQFCQYLAKRRESRSVPTPPELADDPRFTELVEPSIAIARPEFSTKYEAGQYLKECLGIPVSRLRADVGLWSWLAYWWFEQLCPPARRVLENSKYIASPGDHRFGLDKHLLFFPWKMCFLHGEAARCFLSDPVGADSRAQREWTGYHLNVSTPLVELASRLYGAQDRRSLKRGATGKRGGTLRRYVQVTKQLELTYDIHGMTVEQLTAILPSREFSRWLDA